MMINFCSKYMFPVSRNGISTTILKGSFLMTRSSPYSTKFQPSTMPSPMALPEEDQKEFEKLQKIANSQIAIEEYNSQADESSGKAIISEAGPDLKKTTDIGNFPSYFATIPEFEGDVNPKTGEIGGPKQDPTRHGDYSFNGRVTDF